MSKIVRKNNNQREEKSVFSTDGDFGSSSMVLEAAFLMLKNVNRGKEIIFLQQKINFEILLEKMRIFNIFVCRNVKFAE